LRRPDSGATVAGRVASRAHLHDGGHDENLVILAELWLGRNALQSSYAMHLRKCGGEDK